MGTTLLSWPDRSMTGALTGGSWQTSYPLGNLQNPQFAIKARTVNALASSSEVRVDIGSTPRSIQCLAVLSHNLSFAATIRVRGYSDSGYTAMVAGADSGTQYAYPQTLTAEQAAKYADHWIYAFGSGLTARYWLIEIVDTANLAGWIELGRVWLGEGALAPATSFSYGGTFGYECRDVVSESIGGALWGDPRTARRAAVISFDWLAGMEKHAAALMQKALGKTGELLYVRDSGAAAADMLLESFPATLRTVDPLKYPMFATTSANIELVEILNMANIRYSTGGSAADVLARQ